MGWDDLLMKKRLISAIVGMGWKKSPENDGKHPIFYRVSSKLGGGFQKVGWDGMGSP